MQKKEKEKKKEEKGKERGGEGGGKNRREAWGHKEGKGRKGSGREKI